MLYHGRIGGGVHFKGKGRRDGGVKKVGKKNEDEERGGGMCPGYIREESVPS